MRTGALEPFSHHPVVVTYPTVRQNAGLARSTKVRTALVVLASVAIACGGGFFKQYEYEEDCYVSLDGTYPFNSPGDGLRPSRA